MIIIGLKEVQWHFLRIAKEFDRIGSEFHALWYYAGAVR